MGERINKITKRVKRLFKKEDAKKPRPMSASHVICPETVVPEHGKRAPRSTGEFRRSEVETEQYGLKFCVLANGTTHVMFDVDLKTVPVRDPVTRRLSRKELTDGMRKTRGFYDSEGNLHDESGTNW